MNERRMPSPALVIAVAALFVSLGGTAVAAGVVPLAKRALVADTAKKLGGQTPAQLTAAAAKQPGPASSAAGLVTVKTSPWSMAADGHTDVTVMCDAGQKVVGGGYDDPGGYAYAWDTRPTGDGAGWRVHIDLSKDAPSQQTGTVYAMCLR